MLNSLVIVNYGVLFRIFILVSIGIPFCFVVHNSIQSLLDNKRLSRHIGCILQKILFFGGLILFSAILLQELGFNITALLGAAGVIGVAVGFASQTSISNIISGFFLLLERPFSLGDTISCGGVTGVAESIDLLSIKIRTQDNKLVRLPNEMVLKQRVDTLTYYSMRRIDLVLSVPYETNDVEIELIINSIVRSNDLFLLEPKPVVLFNQINFPSLSNDIRLFLSVRVWTKSENFRYATAMLIKKIKQECDIRNIIVIITQTN